MRRFLTYPKICCIYFLFTRGKLIYIGQTTDLRNRMLSHTFNYLHDSIRYIRCRPEKLEEYEKRLIKILKPLANQAFNTANASRVTLPYKEPKWARHYSRAMIFKEALETGNHPWNKVTLEGYMGYENKKFKYYYKAHGYKGTFLDQTIQF